MKNILKSKLTYLILLVVVNVAVVITLCLTLNKKFEYPTDYVYTGTGEDYETMLSDYYLVKRGTITSKEEYESDIIAADTMYSEYTLDSVNISSLSEVKKNDVLGSLDGISVSSGYDGFCLSAIEESGKYKLVVYNYNQFKIQVSLSTNEYLSEPFSKDKVYYVSFGTKEFPISFTGYDMSAFKSGNVIYAEFLFSECDVLVTENTYCILYDVKEKEENVLYTDSIAFDNYQGNASFIIYNGQTAKKVSVTAVKIIDSCAVIESDEIYEGLKLYVS